ncbi:MAG: Mur ligase family protein [Patescibacteria group bacterium]
MLKLWLYRIKRPYHLIKTGLLAGLVSQFKYNFPFRQLTVLAVTGTDGKTTTCNLLYHLLTTASIKTGLISTIGGRIGQKVTATGLHETSPSPKVTMAFAKQLLDAGMTHLVLEVTSHGFYQYRTWGIKPLVLGITNLTHEHLDYHINMTEYLKAKAGLADEAQTVIMGQAAIGFSQFASLLPPKKLLEFGPTQYGSAELAQAIKDRFSEKYNQANAQLAIQMARQIGLTDEIMVKGISTFPGVEGRIEEIETNLPFRVIVDFAHTANGIKSILSALRQDLLKQRRAGRLIAVYGATGLRDRTKRPRMGQVGSELADLVILTADDTRTENIWSIIRQMKEGMTHHHDRVVSIADRGQAIAYALYQAQAGDIVAVLGQGHEKSLCIGTVDYPWSDQEEIRKVLTKLENRFALRNKQRV